MAQSRLAEKLPKEMVHALIEKNARLYLIDAGKLAHSLGLGNRINMIMQGAFFSSDRDSAAGKSTCLSEKFHTGGIRKKRCRHCRKKYKGGGIRFSGNKACAC